MSEQEKEKEQQIKKLDYTIQDPLQRAQFVGQFIKDLPKEQLTEKYTIRCYSHKMSKKDTKYDIICKKK